MIQFNQLRMSEDKSCILIDCQVEDAAVYANKYISAIYIEHYTKRTASSSGPGSNALCLYDTSSKYAIVEFSKSDISSLCTAQGIEDFGTDKFAGEMFYVWVETEGTLTDYVNTTCDMDSTYYTGVVLDWEMVYDSGMRYARDYASGCRSKCSDDKGLIDFILRYNALRLAAGTCDFDSLDSLWPLLFAGHAAKAYNPTCGCFK